MNVDLNTIPMSVSALLGASNGLWTMAYIMCLWLGSKERTYCIPASALAANWGCEFAYIFLNGSPAIVIYCFVPLICVSSLLIYQYFKFASKDIPTPNMPASWIVPSFAIGALASMGYSVFMTRHFQDAGWHYSYFVNLVDSVMWVHMLLRRNSMSGQSLYIAILRMFGSIGTHIAVYVMSGPNYPIFFMTALLITAFDLLYIVMVFAKCRQWGLNPWKVRHTVEATKAPAPGLAAA